MANTIKRLAIITAAGLLSMQAFAAKTDPGKTQTEANANAVAPLALTTNVQKLSYTIGYEMGKNFNSQDVSIQPDLLVTGLNDALKGKTPALNEAARRATILAFQKEVIARQKRAFKGKAEKNAKAGVAFLIQNGKKPGVKILSDGLQYKVLTEGKGQKPVTGDIVTVNYAGSFIDGKVFDSSYKRGKPAVFNLSQVIKGWQQVLPMMPTGSTWEIYVPAKLAYGEHGMGNIIGPNQALVFKIELISINKKKS